MKYFVVRKCEWPGWSYVYSPSMLLHDFTVFETFKAKRTAVKQFKLIEHYLQKIGIIGWIMDTELDRPDIMKLITKLGGKPFYIDIKSEIIWFNKEFK